MTNRIVIIVTEWVVNEVIVNSKYIIYTMNIWLTSKLIESITYRLSSKWGNEIMKWSKYIVDILYI